MIDEKFDPSLIFGEDGPKIGGVRKMCTDHKRCGLGMTCEHAQVRNEACELVSMFEPEGTIAVSHSCKNWQPRQELCSENDIFRSGKPKHNQLRRSNIITTKRHIRDGEDIAGDD